MERNAKQIMEDKIRKAEREYKEKYGRGYCLFKEKHGKEYEVSQRPLWYLASSRFDSLTFNELVMDLHTNSFFEACRKAREMGYHGYNIDPDGYESEERKKLQAEMMEKFGKKDN